MAFSIMTFVRKCQVVVVPIILAVKIDWSWETSLARFFILLINNNHFKCWPSCLSNMCIFWRSILQLMLCPPPPNAHSLSLALSLWLCAILPFAPSSISDIKDDLILCVIINWKNASDWIAVLISKVASIQTIQHDARESTYAECHE